ncbi:MAG: glycoside hydrolase family 15 protein, partial [Proteobacteria bacterium]|nr:glycoside hydrolase family 15 protein [Pseudomonadota bacterium]
MARRVEQLPASEIADYALIGDCETAALVSRTGSIDWLCWPRFDSDACLAALVGAPDNGRWAISPREPFEASRRYRPGGLILETTFETARGVVRLTDFMPPRGPDSHVVRRLEGLRGVVPMRMELVLRFGYGRTIPWVTRTADGLSAVAGPDQVVLRTPLELANEDWTTTAEFDIREGALIPFVMSYRPSHLPPGSAICSDAALEETERFWRGWTAEGRVSGPYAAAVERSLIVLKAMTYAPTGGLVAAPTTSLPEQFGGPRNWDYRYCWIRDATLTLLALMNSGHYDEAAAWRDWLHRAVAGRPEEMQIMYGLGGERRLREWTVD